MKTKNPQLETDVIITNSNLSHLSLQFVRTTIDSLMALRPHGTHTCLVYTETRTLLRHKTERKYSAFVKSTIKFAGVSNFANILSLIFSAKYGYVCPTNLNY
jgi:hypothetical protein